jgi:hypothetical protein
MNNTWQRLLLPLFSPDALALSADGNIAALAGRNGTLCVMDVKPGPTWLYKYRVFLI